MEAKLKEYRALRRRKELIENTKEKLARTKEKVVTLLTPSFMKNMEKHENDDEVLLIENEQEIHHEIPLVEETQEVASEVSEVESLEEVKQESWKYFITKWSIYFITWLTLFIFFLKLQFGAVFFVLSCLIGIYLNTRTSPRKKGEVSAYSVFNENCVSIDGTLKAEQFEREIRYGPASVR
ncbi:hypothetical protein JYU34_018537 [Plutella xylostella]|uniref:Uncharacterized protein n=2 Tax=Plutella xylostella TaxID=51655 RepID=A0ABQ7PZ72_PLUXY|nr:SAYSvFN domain-containing protein 1 [Plutella xylostella]KAG7297795.1 hypothetical protein JYU34_018537 [Plutella xylostella]CAG9128313.1 unnamed protein product [Plutella xylostella]